MNQPERLIYSERDIREAVRKIADRIKTDVPISQNCVVLIVMDGAFMFAAAVTNSSSFSTIDVNGGATIFNELRRISATVLYVSTE